MTPHNGPRRTHVIDSSGVSNTYGQDVLSDIAAGYAGLSAPCRCDYFKVGYSDGSDNGSLDQTVFSDTFDSIQINLTYDDAGNLTDDGIYIYKYDPWNRLVQVKRKSADGSDQVVATYTYDGLGRRIKKVVTNSGDRGRTEYFYYAGWQLVEVRNGSDIAERQFVWGTQYIDEAICMDVDSDSDGDCVDTDGSKRYFYLQDANYNVIAIRRNSTIIERYEYDPYGNVRIFKGYDSAEGHEDMTVIGNSLVDNPILFAGYYFDNETGLYHVRHRMYSPTLQRWLQRDPIWIRPRPPKSQRPVAVTVWAGRRYKTKIRSELLHLYGYCVCSPLQHHDAFGLICHSEITKKWDGTYTFEPQIDQADCYDCCDKAWEQYLVDCHKDAASWKICKSFREFFLCHVQAFGRVLKCYADCVPTDNGWGSKF